MEGDAGSGRLTPPEDDGGEDEASQVAEHPVGDSPAEAPPHGDNERQGDADTEIVADGRSEVEQPQRSAEEGVAARPDAPDSDFVDAPDSEDPIPAQRSRLYSRGWVVGTCATLLVLSLLSVGAGALSMSADEDMQNRNTAEAAAVQAAKDCVIATQAPDLAAMEASQRKIIECGTGDFGAQAVLYSGILVDAYQAANAQVQVSNIRAAAERHNDDGSVDVLVALRVKVSNSTVQDQETGYRLRVQMAPTEGTYKIAQLDQVTK